MLVVSLALVVLQGVADTGSYPQPLQGSTSAVIAVIVPDAATSSMVDALNRLRGEAMSIGFEIRLVEPLAGATTQAKLERVTRDLSPAAVVALSSDGQEMDYEQAELEKATFPSRKTLAFGPSKPWRSASSTSSVRACSIPWYGPPWNPR